MRGKADERVGLALSESIRTGTNPQAHFGYGTTLITIYEMCASNYTSVLSWKYEVILVHEPRRIFTHRNLNTINFIPSIKYQETLKL